MCTQIGAEWAYVWLCICMHPYTFMTQLYPYKHTDIQTNLSEIFICSEVILNLNQKLKDGDVLVSSKKANGIKCERCWKVSEEVNENLKLCQRCEDVINKMKL